MVLVVAAALLSINHAKAESIKITSEFTPIEDLTIDDRMKVLKQIEIESPKNEIDWGTSIIGINEKGQIEVRERISLKLQLVASPTCVGM